jgi:hypothetical protein
MGFVGWIAQYWFDLLQTTSIVAGLFFTAYTIHSDTKERRIQNLLTLTTAHRELWMEFLARPDVHRIYAAKLDLKKSPPTLAERRFVQLLILHLRAAFKARRSGLHFDDDGPCCRCASVL